MSNSDDPKEIYLEPEGWESEEGNRTWCIADIYSKDCDGEMPTKYVRADVFEAAKEEVERLKEMLRKKLDLIKCGIAHNYSGDPYENERYLEAVRALESADTKG